MTVPSSDRVQINLKRQSAIDGTDLASAKTIVNKGRGHNFVPERQFGQSEVSRDDYQPGDNVPISFASRGGWPFSLTYFNTSQGQADVVRALIKSGAPTAETTQVTSCTIAAPNITGTGIHTGLEVGDVLRLRDSSNVLLGLAVVDSVGVDTIGATTFDFAGTTLADGVSCKVLRGARYKNGTTKDYLAAEVGILDSSVYARIKNWIPTLMEMGFGNGRAGVVGTIAGVGTHFDVATSAYSSSLVPDTASPIFAPKVTNTLLRLGSTALQVMEASMRIEHAADLAEIATSNYAIDTVPGTIRPSGSFTTYLTSKARMDLVLSAAEAPLLHAFVDESGNIITLRFPAVRLSGINPSQQGAMLIEQVQWLGESNGAENNTVRIQTFSA